MANVTGHMSIYDSDALAPYVLIAESMLAAPGATCSDLGMAVHRHLRLLRDQSGSPHPDPRWAQAMAKRQAWSRDSFRRYLAWRRLDLLEMLQSSTPSPQSLAQRTWSEIRRDALLSLAFDKHMISRSTSHLAIKPSHRCTQTLVDIGGGPGHYAVQVIRHLSHSWTCAILDTYPDAGWYALPRIPSSRLRINIASGGPEIPNGAGLYLLGSILHNLDDAAALHMLRACTEAASQGSQIVAIERTWDPNSLIDSSRDIDMRLLFGGKERTDIELRTLFSQAGLHVVNQYETKDKYRVMTAHLAH